MCLLGSSLGAAPAFAQGKRQRSETRDQVVALVTESAQHYEAGRFAEAIPLLERAFALEQEPTIQYNLARAHEGLGALPAAIAAYERYLSLAPGAADRGAVEQRLVTLRRQVKDRQELERSADSARQRLSEPAPAPPPPTERIVSSGPGALPWATAGVGAVVLGLGVYFGLRANSTHESAKGAEFAADAADLNRDAQSYALLANIGFVAGGVLTLGGVAWGLATLPQGNDAGAAARDTAAAQGASRGNAALQASARRVAPSLPGLFVSGAF